MPHLSKIPTFIILMLNNINELIVKSSDRSSAKDVMRSIVVYAKENNFALPEEKIDNFYAVLLDCKPYTLSSIVKDIAKDVLKNSK